jgi:penicillin-binding protein 2
LFRRRVIILLACFLLAGGAVAARLAVIQISGHRSFRHGEFMRVGGDHLVETVRGGIYTRWGTPLAEQLPSFDLGVHYGLVADEDWRRSAAALGGVSIEALDERVGEIVRLVERIRDGVRRRNNDDSLHVREEYQHYAVVRDLPPDAAVLVRAEPDRFPGMQVLERTRRVYPNGTLAPHVVGGMTRIRPEDWDRLVQQRRTWRPAMGLSAIGDLYRMDDVLGVSGIERQYEHLLRGERGYAINRLSVGVLKVATHTQQTPPKRGADVFLTLREDFQRAANAALWRASRDPQLDFHAGAIVVVDVRSGAVLAAATWPSYDLSRTSDPEYYRTLTHGEHGPLVFRPVRGALPPGSVFKILTAMAALETGKITEDTTFVCRGVTSFGPRLFHCEGVHGPMTVVPAIEKSCNIFFYNAGLAAGGEALAAWGRLLELGVPTRGLPDPMPTPTTLHGVVNLSIGQGTLLCTPLQIANMMAVVANGGRLYEPHMFHHALSGDGEVIETCAPTFKHVQLNASTLRILREGMRRVVEGGTARHTDLRRYRAAGKTGTAQTARRRPEPDGRSICHAWFAGYAPHDAPKIAFAVVNEDTTGHGGTHAAPIIEDVLWEIWDDVEQMR